MSTSRVLVTVSSILKDWTTSTDNSGSGMSAGGGPEEKVDLGLGLALLCCSEAVLESLKGHDVNM